MFRLLFHRRSLLLIAVLLTAGAVFAEEPALRDGQHDFDFDIGAWKTHSSRLMKPLTGSKDWVELDGMTIVRPVWGGRANLAEYKAHSESGTLELLALRWYNPTAHQWNINFATPKNGTLGVPGVGEFKEGRAEFYDQETYNGKSILVRFSIWPIDHDHAQSEQAFSDDGGKSWEVNWINRYTRLDENAAIDWSDSRAATDASGHDFDFNLGTWHTQIQRIPDPFSSPANSFELSGTVTVNKIWGGRAELEEIETDGPKGHWEGLTLFLYNPEAHQWNQNFLNSQEGVSSMPLIGQFHDGRGELFSQDTLHNRTILVRGTWSQIKPDSHRYEESYSDDGGKTWKPAFIGQLTRINKS